MKNNHTKLSLLMYSNKTYIVRLYRQEKPLMNDQSFLFLNWSKNLTPKARAKTFNVIFVNGFYDMK